ncbi:MAG: 6-carboxytetrahydropterin synthase [Chitinophagales bacterium]
MKATVSRRATFNAAHRLHNPAWDDAKNAAVFGACNNPNYHGHNYTLFVYITGEIDPETGYVIDLGLVSKMIKELVIEPFDHNNLNLDVPQFRDLIPSAENIARVIYEAFRERLDALYVVRIKLMETENNTVYFPG